jgi:hypothetical protein
MKNKVVYILAVMALISFYGKIAEAQDMAEIHSLNFGEFAMLDNNSVHTIVVTPGNIATYDPALIRGIQAQRGEYLLTGLPANEALGITLDNTVDLSHNGLGGGALFTIDTYTTNNPSTNGAGDATLYIGATLSTSGSGSGYIDGPYSGSVDLTINF